MLVFPWLSTCILCADMSLLRRHSSCVGEAALLWRVDGPSRVVYGACRCSSPDRSDKLYCTAPPTLQLARVAVATALYVDFSPRARLTRPGQRCRYTIRGAAERKRFPSHFLALGHGVESVADTPKQDEESWILTV